MRWSLARVYLVVGAVLALMLLLPAWILIGSYAHDRAVDDARHGARVAAALLAITDDRSALEHSLELALPGWADRIAIHGTGLGQPRATTDQVAHISGGGDVLPVPGGVVYLESATPAGDATPVVVEVFVPDADLNRSVAALRWGLVGMATLLLVLIAVASDRIMAKTARATRAIAAGARALGRGEYDARVEPCGPRELAEAGQAFNSMAADVSRRRSTERELIADLSHRLRTPLTALRLEVEQGWAAGSGWYRLCEAVDALECEVDHLINTARRPYEESAAAEPDRCDAGEVVRERMEFWAAVAEDQSRPYWLYGLDQPAPVPLPASELAAAMDALLGNVFRYTPQGTAFEVAVSRRDGHVAVRVDDAGPGIGSRDLALRRGASGAGSTGLGLDIVRRAALAARGGVDIDRASLGGTSVVMLLADAEPAPTAVRQLMGFVGRLKREPGERRRGRRARTLGENRASVPRRAGREADTP